MTTATAEAIYSSSSATDTRQSGTVREPVRVLLLAHEFPPMLSSGCARPLAAARYLGAFGYDPIVLTVEGSRGWSADPSQLAKVPESVPVYRTEHPTLQEMLRRRTSWLSRAERLLGRSEGWLADAVEWRLRRWSPRACARRDELCNSWAKPALRAGLELVRRYRPGLIWATAPPFETLKAAYQIARRTDLPLIVDFRDPWTHGVCWAPRTKREAARERAWESRVLSAASRVVFTTPLTEARMRDQFPEHAAKFRTIMNGFFSDGSGACAEVPRSDRMTISYVGNIGNQPYRRPTIVFDALEIVKQRFPEIAARILVRFVGPSPSFEEELRSRGIEGMVEFVGPVSFAASQEYMRSSDVLLLLQLIEDGKDVIGGKLFEYLAARRPILGVVSPGGGDDWLLRQSGAGPTVGIKDPEAIAFAIAELIQQHERDELQCQVDDQWLAQFDRRALTGQLAHVFDEALGRNQDGRIA